MSRVPRPSRATREAAHWHARQREGALDAQAQDAFMDWMVASPEHLREYLAVARVAGALRDALQCDDVAQPVQGAPSPASPASFAETRGDATRTTNNVLPDRRGRVRTHRRRQRVLAVAASLLVALGIGGQLLPETTRHVAAHGSRQRFDLPDGTRVHLNADSVLSTRIGPFSREAKLLRGQASFEVAEDRREFSVRAAGLRVRDIGTTFDVALERDHARVSVSEGRVQVFDADDGAGDRAPLADLDAGRRARVDHRDHAVQVSAVDVASMTAWWDGRIVFRDEPLQVVADAFNRGGHVRLRVGDATAGALPLTGNLRADDVDSLIAWLEQHPALALARDGDDVVVRSR